MRRALVAVLLAAVWTSTPTSTSTSTSKVEPPLPSGERAGVRGAASTVQVLLLTKQAPRRLTLVRPGQRLRLEASGDALLVDGRQVAGSLHLPEASWTVLPPELPARTYRGALELRAAGGLLHLTGHLPLETYVAQVLASEAGPGTPPAALKAQAVVIRSYAQAARGRHPAGALCDLAHCQLLRGAGAPKAHLAAAEAATRATVGQVLTLPGGGIAEATFHAQCGGHTADPRLAFGGGWSGAEPTADPGCEAAGWSARLGRADLAEALRSALRVAGDPAAERLPGGLGAEDLALRRGPGGWVAQVSDRAGAWRLSGDAVARALDAAVGRGRIRSTRFTLGDEGAAVRVRGSGHGHGVGLCQAGAARRARAGQPYQDILSGYFQGAVLTAGRGLVGRAGRVGGAPGLPGARTER